MFFKRFTQWHIKMSVAYEKSWETDVAPIITKSISSQQHCKKCQLEKGKKHALSTSEVKNVHNIWQLMFIK